MEVACRRRTYHLRNRFTISSGGRDTVDAVEVTFAHDRSRRAGRGESAPSKRVTGHGPGDVAELVEGWWARHGDDPPAPPAKAPFAGLDAALLDHEGRARGEPVHALLGLEPATRPTSVTVSLDDPKAMVEEARSCVEDGLTHLKVKVGEGPADRARVEAIREALPEATIRVDANGGWGPDEAADLIPQLAGLDVELVEQPLPVGADVTGLPDDLPVFADESLVAADDLDALDGYDGIVAKVDKHGGPRPTREILEAARDRGLSTMIGCNVQSSLGIAAAAHLLALADLADLDGGWLLADDPYQGVPIDGGRVATPTGPGLGVEEAST